MKNVIAIGLVLLANQTFAQSYVWVQTNFSQPQDTYFYQDGLLFYGRDNISVNENSYPKTYSVNTTQYLFVRLCTGAVTNEPSWHPDVMTLQTSGVFQTFPLVGSGTFNTSFYWGITYYTRNTSESFEKYNSQSLPTGEIATRQAEERVVQTIWVYGV